MKQPAKHAIVESVEYSDCYPATYPFFVQGVLITNQGNTEHFSWHVSNLGWPCYDFSNARISNEALAIAI